MLPPCNSARLAHYFILFCFITIGLFLFVYVIPVVFYLPVSGIKTISNFVDGKLAFVWFVMKFYVKKYQNQVYRPKTLWISTTTRNLNYNTTFFWEIGLRTFIKSSRWPLFRSVFKMWKIVQQSFLFLVVAETIECACYQAGVKTIINNIVEYSTVFSHTACL